MPILFRKMYNSSSIESISLAVIPHPIDSLCANSNDVNIDNLQSMPLISPHAPNNVSISNDISIDEDMSAKDNFFPQAFTPKMDDFLAQLSVLLH